MSFTIRRAAAAVASVVVVGAALLTTAGAAQASAAPPWEPDGSSVGGLLFYNASGDLITGGSVNDQPLATYVEGTNTIRSGDTKATLFGYLPVDGQVPGEWQGEAIGTATVYPNHSAPGALASSSLPVNTGAAGDESVATLAVDFPNLDTSGDGYAGIYQLRLRTSASGLQPTQTYDSADIQITGDTWSVVYDATSIATATKLTVSPSASAYHATTVSLKATVTPASAVGSVTFLDGTKSLGKVAVKKGVATLSTKALSNATHKLKATFAPTDSAAYVASTSSVHLLDVRAHATKITLKASSTTVKKGKKLTLTATETPKVAGVVAFYDGSKKLGTAKVKKGKARFATTKLKVGTTKLKATFTPSNTANDKASTSKTVKVKVTG
jgi:hypothetical protein